MDTNIYRTYPQLTRETDSPFYKENTNSLGLPFAVLGLVSECVEIRIGDNYVEELGDIMWYHARASLCMEIDYVGIFQQAVEMYHTVDWDNEFLLLEDKLEKVLRISGKLSGYIKKCADKVKEYQPDEVKQFLVEIAVFALAIARDLNTTLEAVMRQNLDKLLKRHGGKGNFDPSKVKEMEQ